MAQIRHISKIPNDDYTQHIYTAYDIQNKEETITEIENNLTGIKTFDWNIGVIFGGSGSGKTSILKTMGELADATFDPQKALVSNFDWLTPDAACKLLSSMGLSSVPCWLRPFHTLSNGEQYRAMLAYKVGKAKPGETILIDEYTSVVDRDVAKAMSNALQKYIRRENKKIILASCHFDIMEWLRPDWTYSPMKGRLDRATRLRQRPPITLQIVRCRYETWSLFKQYHYLTHDLNKSAVCFLALWNDKPVAFSATLPFPHGNIKNGRRMSRLVTLPDYQGLGIGPRLNDYIVQLYATEGYNVYVKTSNTLLWARYDKYPDKWKLTTSVDESRVHDTEWFENQREGDAKGILGYRQAVTKTYKYIGPPSDDDTSIIKFKTEVYRDVAQNQISLF
jgi:ABC-type lipoprotein export system ATPase subunit/GNAT superfamily N-acetyltransferase